MSRDYGSFHFWRRAGMASRICRSAPVPVLVIPPSGRGIATGDSLPGAEVVAATDFTVASAIALRAAVDIAERKGGRVTIVHAMKNVPGHMVFSGGEAARVVRELPGRTADVTGRLLGMVPDTAIASVQPSVSTGIPYRHILNKAAEVNADLIVMGVAPRTGLDQAVFGSTLRRVILHANVPVLVIPVVGGAYEWRDHLEDGS